MTAFIYLISPVQAISGIVRLGKTIIGFVHEITQICEDEESGTGAYDATLKYLEGLEKGYANSLFRRNVELSNTKGFG